MDPVGDDGSIRQPVFIDSAVQISIARDIYHGSVAARPSAPTNGAAAAAVPWSCGNRPIVIGQGPGVFESARLSRLVQQLFATGTPSPEGATELWPTR